MAAEYQHPAGQREILPPRTPHQIKSSPKSTIVGSALDAAFHSSVQLAPVRPTNPFNHSAPEDSVSSPGGANGNMFGRVGVHDEWCVVLT
jgi:hypothetical protein